ncbi:bifunctional diaminohydroxyphosphoribosylaminopyrimidine deaminase/5-amino-6-(5-phosphoribosylamino)uracil reductase RibD [Paenibacillus montanisoli]|uniref:Riboflavin biosynthesis protein RibD n=1 Tax=Paenibacillus montanisoli TaxID=2081970 RepID=A0A328U2Z0_9BACL|nr:bifunctional diaminohydroxyphosphoribosylaminopyrimidine deaminase/5-amino-6-(5-phosphoribosylamino)uracil reductase RibD [Paenibacillus montanisoli]RAP76442.1 bifunctional diaminohydroxyphosphoribosylaminopyrimidine deaminase/5-amino-6-(5-phosphoribosylamino)uracil reductase RibD [Paenibacillus montanisoli]
MSIAILNDEMYMRLALDMASKAQGQTEINPVVGCVVVKEGRIVGLGAHLRRGEGHAEVHALKMAGEQAEGATVYVTLEPCSHHGRTPPCCERIIEAKAARVVVACTDPNPQVAGRGIERIRQAGIAVDVGLLGEESMRMNEMFNKYIVTKLPFVTMKSAMTLDGKLAAKTGDSRYVSGPAARELTHSLRHRHMGIMIGVETALADDPELTTRLSVPAVHPVRIIVDSSLRLPPQARMLQDRTSRVIVLTTAGADEAKRNALTEAGAEVLACGAGTRVDLKLAMQELGVREIGSILLEGGGKLNGAMLELGLIDKVMIFVAPKVIGGTDAPGVFQFGGFEKMSDAIPLREMSVEQVGSDILISGYFRSPFGDHSGGAE